jgi:hypothetical protein
LAVAKSYEKMDICGDPFKEKGRYYVIVRDPAKGTKKRVRWYSDAEYQKMYNTEPKAVKEINRKNPLGFSKGYVTIFKGPIAENEEWFKLSKARKCNMWGWYYASDDELVIEDLPTGIEPVELKWEEVENIIDDPKRVREVVYLKLNPGQSTPYIDGRKGERLSLAVIIEEVETFTNEYGQYYIYTMKDPKNQLYIWKTQAQKWEKNSVKVIKGTIKEVSDHYIVLTRCMEVK